MCLSWLRIAAWLFTLSTLHRLAYGRIMQSVLDEPQQEVLEEKHSRSSYHQADAHGKITPKVMIFSYFARETAVWHNDPDLDLFARNISVPGLSPRFPQVLCTADGEVCHFTTDMGEIHAAASTMALWMSDRFELSSTYFLLAGIGGINPHMGTIGSVSFARYAVQLDLQYLFSESQVPTNFPTGFVPQKSHRPNEYPGVLYGTEVFELNDRLRMRAVQLARRAVLNDTVAAMQKRAAYPYAPANKPPTVLACDTMTSNNWWSGSVLGDAFAGYVSLLTNGSAKPCTTQQEDNATLEALLRGAVAGRLDFSRVILMRTASDFARAPPGRTEYEHLVNTGWEGFVPALQNVYSAGIEIVRDVLQNWDGEYASGIRPENYIGDLWNSLDRVGGTIASKATRI